MTSFITIQLNNLRFFAKHGMFAEEISVGNEFEVNLTIDTLAPKAIVTSIEETINYAEVYEVVKQLFSERKQLLETLAMEVTEALKNRFPAILSLKVQIIKLHPPITGFIGSVSITYNKQFK